jgi:Adenine-specific methyltransferase EcoRI
MAKSVNNNLEKAKAGKNDEFYTQLSDIEKELRHYKKYFKDKTVFCNCDDPRVSNFFHYFSYNFEALGLKKLITTCYKNQDRDLFSTHQSEKAVWLEYNGDKNGDRIPNPEEIGINYMQTDGDFRSAESIELLKQADIIVTNPPFSLFREYVAQLLENDKKFLIIGNGNSITYKEIFRNIQDNKIWLGVTKPQLFLIDNKENFAKYCSDLNKVVVEDKEYWAVNISVGTPTYWFTNLDTLKRHEDIILYKTYDGNETEYPKYVNYDAIEVGKVKDIPVDYEGAMGVPITFLDKYNPDQFEIIGSSITLGVSMSKFADKGTYSAGGPRFYLDNGDGTYRRLYDRIVIRKIKK